MEILSTILIVALGIIVLFVPSFFIIRCITALFSATVRENIRKHKIRHAAWGFCSLICLFILTAQPPGGIQLREAKIAKTQNELTQIQTAILSYYTEYSDYPDTSDNRKLMEILQGTNPHDGENSRGIAFINLKPSVLNANGEFIDAWGTPFHISLDDPQHPSATSAGPDKTWGTADDIGTRETGK